jgi:hypothetical protein
MGVRKCACAVHAVIIVLLNHTGDPLTLSDTVWIILPTSARRASIHPISLELARGSLHFWPLSDPVPHVVQRCNEHIA